MVIKIKLDVEHFDQLDNNRSRFGHGNRQCSLTSHAMLVNYLLGGRLWDDARRNGHKEPESVYGWNLKKYGDTTQWMAHTNVMNKVYGIETRFRQNANQRDLIRLLQAGIPIPIGVEYKNSGHVVLVVGYEGTLNQYGIPNNGFFWVHDPYGIRAGTTSSYAVLGNHSGAYDKYSVDLLNRLWNEWRDTGWCTEVTKRPAIAKKTEPISSTESNTAPKDISQAGINLIKKWEGLRLQAYLCPANVWTIGYGSTKGVKKGDVVTVKEAEELLRRDLQRFIATVNESVKVPLTQNQFDALVSFTFNVGQGAFKNSTLLRILNQGDYAGVPAQLARWNKGGGKVLPGLTARRKDEANLWVTK